jgi:ribonucleoside-diphosphate reductase alpha chain
MANNSAVYNAKPSAEEFLDEWTALVKSKSGERGIFNRGGLEKQLPARRWQAIKEERQVGLNPCGEIYLRSKQFCNLTSIVIRPNDTVQTLKRKMELATLLGTYQSTLTNFGYISKKWKENCEAPRFLSEEIMHR